MDPSGIAHVFPSGRWAHKFSGFLLKHDVFMDRDVYHPLMVGIQNGQRYRPRVAFTGRGDCREM